MIFYSPPSEVSLDMPYIHAGIKAGFPSPAADFDENRISLDQTVVRNVETTFYARAVGTSMVGAGIDDGDLLVIDRSLEPQDGKVAVCFIDGEFTVKRIRIREQKVWLMPENPDFEPIEISDENEFLFWGMVTHVVKKL